MTVAVRFVTDRGTRRVGDVVRYDDASAAHIVSEGVAEFVEPDRATPAGDTPTGYEITDPDPGFQTASVENGD